MNKKKEMKDFFEEHGPKRRPRSEEWLDKRITRLEWILTREHYARMPSGSHHLFNEMGMFNPPFPLPLENIEAYSKKRNRLLRLAILHNRYLDQYCDIRGMIIN